MQKPPTASPFPPAQETPQTQPNYQPPAHAAAFEDGVSVFFSPGGHCTEAIVEQIDKAKASVQVQAYRLTSVPIAEALVRAHKRGIKVSILLDGAQQSDKYSDATFFHNHGMLVFIDTSHTIAHNKVMLIDGETVITGSFNFSEAAETANAENLLIIQGKQQIVDAYSQNIASHLQHIEVYKAPGDTLPEPSSRVEDSAGDGSCCVSEG